MEKRVEDPYIGECVFRAKVHGRRITIRIYTTKYKTVWDIDSSSLNDVIEIKIVPKGLKRVTCDCGFVDVRVNDFAEISIALTTKIDENTVKELLSWIEEIIRDFDVKKIKILTVTKISEDILKELGYEREGFFFVKTSKSS